MLIRHRILTLSRVLFPCWVVLALLACSDDDTDDADASTEAAEVGTDAEPEEEEEEEEEQPEDSEEPAAGPPVISLVGSDTIEVAFGTIFSDLGAVAVDAEGSSLEVTVDGSVDTSTPGTYELTYSATDSAGASAETVRTVEVIEDPLDTATLDTPNPPGTLFLDGRLVDADYWSDVPMILSAGMGFDGIIGLEVDELTQDLVQEAGGAWSDDIDCGDDIRNITSVATRDGIGGAYIQLNPYGPLRDGASALDGLPIVFTWPVVTNTLGINDFQFTLNTGDIVRAQAVSSFPNGEYNERNVIVAFGEFGNRLPTTDPDARYPIKVEIVADENPLLLVGPDGVASSAVGMTWETDSSPYDENNGPSLVGAKLNRIDGQMGGEGLLPVPVLAPNDANALYDEGDFMLRMLTTGGFSPDGVSGLRPTDYEKFFRIHATGTDGSTVLLEEVGETYAVSGGTLRVVGLAELGAPEGDGVSFDECYDEDLDNYIDIILVGDEAAARSITHLEIPSLAGGYQAFYNPGGPGRTPFEGVTYTEPGPPDLEPVIIALDDPMRVSYEPDPEP